MCWGEGVIHVCFDLFFLFFARGQWVSLSRPLDASGVSRRRGAEVTVSHSFLHEFSGGVSSSVGTSQGWPTARHRSDGSLAPVLRQC